MRFNGPVLTDRGDRAASRYPGSFRAVLLELRANSGEEFDSLLVLGSAASHEADEWIQAVTAFVLVLAIRVARKPPKVTPVGRARIATEPLRQTPALPRCWFLCRGLPGV